MILGKYAEGRTDHGILGEVTPRAQQTAGTRRVSAEMHPMTLASSGTPKAKQTTRVRGILANAQGAHSPSAITRRGNGHRKESDPIPILCLSYSEIPIRFQSGSNEVPMEIGGT